MAEQDFKRKLTAILSADVEGYSLLMRDDEEATIRTLTIYRKAIKKLIQQYRGRLVDATGDNFLSEFTSVVDAVNCAVEIQRELAERNAEHHENRRMQFRIGINLGDVVEEEGRIYGDGVNIAARMEGLAEGGGICISGKVYEEVKNKLGLEYEYLGEKEVKNISEPVQAYRVLSYPGAAAHRVVKAKKAVGKTWRNISLAVAVVLVVGTAVAIWNFHLSPEPSVEVASVEKTAHPLPDKPSIAVLPFVNISDDPKQEYFSDGITEEIITGLSKLPDLFVIASNSVFTYKGKSVNVQRVGRELGVRYVLEGSVRKSGDRVRITAQLIDSTTGGHIWSERYDRDLKDIFILQDELTKKIMAALQIKLTIGEEARLYAKGTDKLEAYLKYLQGRQLILAYNKEANARGRSLIEESIAIDPNYAPAYYALSGSIFLDVLFGISKSPKESVTKAIKFCQKAITLDETLSVAHAWLGCLYSNIGKYDEGIEQCKRGVELGPSDVSSYRYLAMALRYAGKWDESIMAAKMAIRLDPFTSSNTLQGLGLAYAFTGQFEDAIEACKKATARNPNDLFSHVALTAIYVMADRVEEANSASKEVLRIDPKFSGEQHLKRLKWRKKEDKERFLNALEMAGL